MEEIISVELCIIPAGICIGTEGFSTTGYFEVAGYGGVEFLPGVQDKFFTAVQQPF